MYELNHAGTPHEGSTPHSGRYPWGSGDRPAQRNKSFRDYVAEMRKEGLKDTEIAKRLDMTTSEFRSKISYEKELENEAKRKRVEDLKAHGYSGRKIEEMTGIPEATQRYLLKNSEAASANKLQRTMDEIKKCVDSDTYVDVGVGTEINLGVTETMKKNAIKQLENEGYKVHKVYVDQMGTDHQTTIKVLTKDDIPYSDVMEHKYDIVPLAGKRTIGVDGDIRTGAIKPVSVDSKRLKIVYNEEGGVNSDGLIELRRGVEDISLGNSRYAQVRIAVDDKYYLKGMARYADDLPPGVDIRFNTNKHVGTPTSDVLKKLDVNADNPFGSSVTQREYIGKDGKKHVSALNIVNEEGDWNNWSKNLASQFLSKQDTSLARRQLDLVQKSKKQEFEEICALTNPTVKRQLLKTFSDECDASAIDLKAAPLPRQRTQVILPLNSINDHEIFAPNFKDGTTVCLVRYPHGGTFEIPTLKVNNKSKEGRSVIGATAKDAVGIHHKVAERLSGADFDGDTVLVLPVGTNVKIRTSKPLKGLIGFDPKEEYRATESTPMPYKDRKGNKSTISYENMQKQMGVVSNLISDMTLKGVNNNRDLELAIKHSMTVIDSEKHHLDWKRSERENEIARLKKEYQGSGGASTIISRAKSPVYITGRKTYKLGKNSVDPVTGEKIYKYTDNPYAKPVKYKRMGEEKDAFKLTSGGSKENPGHPMEAIYASHANYMKALANKARLEYINTPNLKYSPEAKKKYSSEVDSLDRKLKIATSNAPVERQAQLLANKKMAAIIDSNPYIKKDKDKFKKEKGRSLIAARTAVGAKKEPVKITDKEWEAIQKGAISETKLKQILNNADLDTLRKLATPKHSTVSVSDAKKATAISMKNAGYTTSEIAERLGVSTTTVSNIINE